MENGELGVMAKNINTVVEPVENTTEIEAPYELPDGWKWYKIQDFVDIFLGLTHTPEYVDNGIPFLSVKDMSSGYIDFSNTKYISEEEYKGLPRGAKPKQGDILFARAGTIGIPQIIDTDRLFGIFVSLGFFRLKQENLYTKKFIIHWMNSILFEHQVNANIKGSTIKNLNTGWLKKFYIPLPPTLEEQQRIVNRIETLFAKLDQATEKAQNVVDSFETRKASILHKAFTGEFTKKWRDENGVGDDSWMEKTIGECLKFHSGDAIKVRKVETGKYPIYGGNGINGYYLENNVDKDTLVIGRVGFYCGSVHITIDKAWVTDNALILNFSEVLLDKIFLLHLLNYKKLGSFSNSTAQPVISGKVLNPIKIKIPSLPEQQEIVCILDVILERENKAKEAAEAVLEQIDLLKKSILARAFRGEL